jgi:hypothetical protein
MLKIKKLHHLGMARIVNAKYFSTASFSHVDERGEIQMVDVGKKIDTQRKAVAKGYIQMQSETFSRIKNHQIAKGNTTLHNKRNKLNRELDKLINIKDHKEQIGLRTQTPLETYLADSHLRTKLDPLTGIFRDTKTGLYAELKPLGDGNFALCFGSTGVGRMMSKQIKVDIDQVLNQKKVPAAYTQAVDLAAELIKEVCLFGSEITVTGQSMGGGIANYVGLKLGIKSVCYNAAALGGAAIQDLQISTYKTENNIERACLDKDNINNQIQVRRNRDIFSGEKQQIKISQLQVKYSP